MQFSTSPTLFRIESLHRPSCHHLIPRYNRLFRHQGVLELDFAVWILRSIHNGLEEDSVACHVGNHGIYADDSTLTIGELYLTRWEALIGRDWQSTSEATLIQDT